MSAAANLTAAMSLTKLLTDGLLYLYAAAMLLSATLTYTRGVHQLMQR